MQRLLIVIIATVLLLTACGQAPAATPAPVPTGTAPPEAPALIGSWKTTVTKEDLLRVAPDFQSTYLCENAGTFVWQFKPDGTFAIDQTVLDGCAASANPHIDSTWTNAGNVVTLAPGAPDQEMYEWTVAGDMLTFVYRSGDCIPCKATNTANAWMRIAK